MPAMRRICPVRGANDRGRENARAAAKSRRNDYMERTGKPNEIATGRAADLIAAAADRYAAESPPPDARPQDRTYISWYRAGLLEIGRTVSSLGISDLTTLDALFRRVYIPYAVRAGVMPTIADFGLFTGIDPDRLAAMDKRTNTVGYSIYQGWLNILKQYVIGYLSTEPGSNVNLIFIAKSTFGIHDDRQPSGAESARVSQRSRSEIIAELAGTNEESGNVDKDSEQK